MRNAIGLVLVFSLGLAVACQSDADVETGVDTEIRGGTDTNAPPGPHGTDPTAPPDTAGTDDATPVVPDTSNPDTVAPDTSVPDTAALDTSGNGDTDSHSEADTGEPQGSAGCGIASPMQSGTFSVTANNKERTFVVDVPQNYDGNRPHRLFFTWHWLGGNASDVVNLGYYGIKAESDGSAIFVSPQGLGGGGDGTTGWWNANGEDVQFLDEMMQRLLNNLCIDPQRVFSTGFSFGGMMSNTIGCQRSSVFRAIAPMAGNLMGRCANNDAVPIAFFGVHGDADSGVTTQSGRDARDIIVARNHCRDETRPAGGSFPDYCIEYEGCDAGYPVFWCEFPGEHQLWFGSGKHLWNFFSRF